MRLLTTEKQLEVAGGAVDGGRVKWAMGIKKGTHYDEHWVSYVSDQSLNSTPEINTTLYVNYLEFKWNIGRRKKEKVLYAFLSFFLCIVDMCMNMYIYVFF